MVEARAQWEMVAADTSEEDRREHHFRQEAAQDPVERVSYVLGYEVGRNLSTCAVVIGLSLVFVLLTSIIEAPHPALNTTLEMETQITAMLTDLDVRLDANRNLSDVKFDALNRSIAALTTLVNHRFDLLDIKLDKVLTAQQPTEAKNHRRSWGSWY